DVPDVPTDFNDLIAILQQLERYNLLFIKHLFSPSAISFLLTHKEIFGITNLKSLKADEIKNISLYKALLLDDEEVEDELQKALTGFQTTGSFTGFEATWADIFKQPQALIKSLFDHLTFTIPALPA